jgi:hypothetical protein
MSDFSDFGVRTTDAFLAKKVEAEVKKLKTTTSTICGQHITFILICNLDPAFFGLIVVVSGAIS